MRRIFLTAAAAVLGAGLAACGSGATTAGSSPAAAGCSGAGLQKLLYQKGVLTVATDKPAYDP